VSAHGNTGGTEAGQAAAAPRGGACRGPPAWPTGGRCVTVQARCLEGTNLSWEKHRLSLRHARQHEASRAAGRPEGDLEAEWAALGGAAGALAAAPGDELLGEILALQFELAQQARACPGEG
jgi:hypothetical protein